MRKDKEFKDFPICKKLNEDILKWKHYSEYQIDTTRLSSTQTADKLYIKIIIGNFVLIRITNSKRIYFKSVFFKLDIDKSTILELKNRCYTIGHPGCIPTIKDLIKEWRKRDIM